MHINLHDPASIILSIAAFGLVLSLWCAVILIWTARQSIRRERVQQRLGIGGNGDAVEGRVLRLWRGESDVTTVVAGKDVTVSERFARLLAAGGWTTPPQTVLLGLLGVLALAFAITLVMSASLPLSLGVVVAILQLLWIYVNGRIIRRVAHFERQLVDALSLAARSLRVGHPLVGSFQLISEEIGAPIGPIFAQIVQQQGLGTSLDEAIRRASEQAQNADLKLFATSVVIQLRSGGNLADMMERLADILRERMRLTRRVRVLTAQTQMSKNILLAMPLVTVVGLNLLNPAYMRPLWTTTSGHYLVAASLTGLLLGAWMMSVLASPKH